MSIGNKKIIKNYYQFKVGKKVRGPQKNACPPQKRQADAGIAV
jgi:hypothetical protein